MLFKIVLTIVVFVIVISVAGNFWLRNWDLDLGFESIGESIVEAKKRRIESSYAVLFNQILYKDKENYYQYKDTIIHSLKLVGTDSSNLFFRFKIDKKEIEGMANLDSSSLVRSEYHIKEDYIVKTKAYRFDCVRADTTFEILVNKNFHYASIGLYSNRDTIFVTMKKKSFFKLEPNN